MKKLTACLLAGLFCSLAVSSAPAAEDIAQDNVPLTAPNPINLNVVPAESLSIKPDSDAEIKAAETDVINCLPSPIAAPKDFGTCPAAGVSNTAAKAKSVKNAKTSCGKKDKLTAQNNIKKLATQHNSPAPAAGVGKKIKVKAYAYCIHGRTASGSRTGLGTIAVDPSVIPLGSKMYIPGYGWGTALDTGGNMRGNVIDIWYPSNGECMNWGVRSVTVTVLPR